MLKLEASPADAPRAGWRETIQEHRSEIEAVLADSPGLRRTIPAMIESALGKARRGAALALAGYGGRPCVELGNVRYAPEQVLGDWLPDEP